MEGGTPFAIQRKYNPYGFLNQVVDANTGSLFWEADAQNARGRTTTEVFGKDKSVVSQIGYYDNGLFKSIKTSEQGGDILQDLFYTYYPNHSLWTRTDRLPRGQAIQEVFTYDSLDRLKTWSSLPLPPAVPKHMADQTFNYDDIGNLKERSAQAGTGSQLVYNYGENGAGPHAVTSVNENLYTYNDGNQISGPNRSVAYKAFNLPASITQGATKFSFEYDASHRRAVKRDQNGNAVTYVGGMHRDLGGKRRKGAH